MTAAGVAARFQTDLATLPHFYCTFCNWSVERAAIWGAATFQLGSITLLWNGTKLFYCYCTCNSPRSTLSSLLISKLEKLWFFPWHSNSSVNNPKNKDLSLDVLNPLKTSQIQGHWAYCACMSAWHFCLFFYLVFIQVLMPLLSKDECIKMNF